MRKLKLFGMGDVLFLKRCSMRNTIIALGIIFSFCLCVNATDVQQNPESTKNTVDNGKAIKKSLSQTENKKVTQKTVQEKAAKIKAAKEAALLKKKEQIEKAKQAFTKKMKELQNQRRMVSLEIYKLRVKLIKEDPDMQALQKSVMKMHRKMAIDLNAKPQMKRLLANAKKWISRC